MDVAGGEGEDEVEEDGEGEGEGIHQLAGRNDAKEDDEEELLDAVPFAAVSRQRSVRFPISLLSSVKLKTYLDDHSWNVESGQRHMHLEGIQTRSDCRLIKLK